MKTNIDGIKNKKYIKIDKGIADHTVVIYGRPKKIDWYSRVTILLGVVALCILIADLLGNPLLTYLTR